MKGLYIVTPDWDDTAKLLAVTKLALDAGAVLVQYRHKLADATLRYEQALALQQLCRLYHRPFIINDFVDLCIALDADGVHVGGTDVSVAEARAQLGVNKIIGASCYGSLSLAQDAHHAGASYVAFGGFYPSIVKRYPVTTDINVLAQAKNATGLPCIVIGGMTPDNAQPLVAAGADMVAAISSVYLAVDPYAAAQKIAELFL